jgi:hypothetical protein
MSLYPTTGCHITLELDGPWSWPKEIVTTLLPTQYAKILCKYSDLIQCGLEMLSQRKENTLAKGAGIAVSPAKGTLLSQTRTKTPSIDRQSELGWDCKGPE